MKHLSSLILLTIMGLGLSRTINLNRFKSYFVKSSICISIGITNINSFSFDSSTLNSNQKILFKSNPTTLIANADSTGKFSSKMTAKKRYLPRVIEGVNIFESVINSEQELNNFIDSELKGLARAMDLYGASLRKGEVPDEISREATRLTNEFNDSVIKLKTAKSGDKEKAKSEALSTLKNYLEFAKITNEDLLVKAIKN